MHRDPHVMKPDKRPDFAECLFESASPVESAGRVRGERHEIGRNPKEEYVVGSIE